MKQWVDDSMTAVHDRRILGKVFMRKFLVLGIVAAGADAFAPSSMIKAPSRQGTAACIGWVPVPSPEPRKVHESNGASLHLL